MLAGKILDFYDDVHGQYLIEDAEMLEKVGHVKALPVEDRYEVPVEECALVLIKEGQMQRKFIVNSPDHTTLSQEYFVKTAGALPPRVRGSVAYFIKRACEKWDLECDEFVAETADGHTPTSPIVIAQELEGWKGEKVAVEKPKIDLSEVPDEEFAEVVKTAAEVRRSYPMHTPETLSASIYHFASAGHESRNLAQRAFIADKLCKKADEIGVIDGVNEHLESLRAMTEYDIDDTVLRAAIQQRKMASDDEEDRKLLDELMENGKTAAEGVCISQLVSAFDEARGFDKKYDSGMIAPSAFIVEKSAEYDSEFSPEIVLKIASGIDGMKDILGEDIVSKFAEDPNGTFMSLSPAARDMLVTAAKQGVL